MVEDSTELSLPSFTSDSEDGRPRPSWERSGRLKMALENLPDPNDVFGPVGQVDYLPRGSDGPMCALTPLSLPSSVPTTEISRTRTRKRYRTTPYAGDRVHNASPPPSPLTGKSKGDVEPPLRDRTRSAKKVLPLGSSSLSSQPPRRKPWGGLPRVPLVPKAITSKPSLLKQAPRRKASRKAPPLSHQSPSDEPLSLEQNTCVSYEEFAPHIPLEIGSVLEGQFNMFRVDPKSNHAILTPTVIKELLQGAERIARTIWLSPILDDSRLRFRLGGGSKDFLDLPHLGSRIMDVESVISKKIDINTESAALWEFFRYCVLRVEDATTRGNPALRKELGRYKQDVAMLYECFLGIFYRLGSVWDGRQLSLLHSLCESTCQRCELRLISN